MKSTIYARVRIVVEHADDVNPEDVISECLYNFEASIERGDSGTITDTEIVEVEKGTES